MKLTRRWSWPSASKWIARRSSFSLLVCGRGAAPSNLGSRSRCRPWRRYPSPEMFQALAWEFGAVGCVDVAHLTSDPRGVRAATPPL
eukprot:6946602-Pyramimonas_sp.AAC.1